MTPEHKTTIFIVDAEQIIANTLAIILNGQGYLATAFYSRLTILGACEDGAPEVILSDVVMPGMTGVDLAITMGKRYPACKTLLFAGHSQSSMYLEAAWEKDHRCKVQPKPIHPVDLFERLRQLMRVD